MIPTRDVVLEAALQYGEAHANAQTFTASTPWHKMNQVAEIQVDALNALKAAAVEHYLETIRLSKKKPTGEPK